LSSATNNSTKLMRNMKKNGENVTALTHSIILYKQEKKREGIHGNYLLK
jgi:hypothetical protein